MYVMGADRRPRENFDLFSWFSRSVHWFSGLQTTYNYNFESSELVSDRLQKKINHLQKKTGASRRTAKKKRQKKTLAASRPIFFKKKRQKLQNKTIIFIENTLNILKTNVFGRR